MIQLKKAVNSSIGQKFLMALSGLGLVGFVITHLAGNLALYLPDGAPFNAYAAQLESFGKLLYVAEIGLIFIFVLHIVTAIRTKAANRAARPEAYRSLKSKGGESRFGFAANNMIITGLVLLVFVILHVWQFKYGPGIAEGYTTTINGVEHRDLHRLVVETFQNPIFVGLYVAVMLLLGAHLRHGFWSAFQSLGALNPRISPSINALGIALAVLLSAGFLGIPLWIFFTTAGGNA
jgi:succinate dehydrogenase / fumarate reductase cytochrome b subunit